MASARETAPLGEWRRGWPLVLVSTLGASVGSMHIHTLGAAMQPLQKAFGWERGEIAGSLGITAAMCVLFATVVGVFIDRYGSRRVAIVGVIWMCLAIAGLSLAGPSIFSWWFLWFLVSCGVVLTNPTIWAAAIAGAFDRGRGVAIAIMLCGTGLSATILPYLMTVLIAHVGWRLAYVVVAAIWGAVALPLVLLFFFDRRAPASAGPVAIRPPRLSVLKDPEVRSLAFLKVAVSGLICTVAYLGCSIHLLPNLTDHGLSRGAAAAVVALMGPAAIVGRMATGFILDRTRSPLVGAAIVLTPAISSLILLFAPITVASASLAALLLGVGLGGELHVVTFLVSRFFSLEQFGRLNGLLVAFLGLGTGLGPFLAGEIFDITGSYKLWLAIVVPVSLVAWGMLSSLGRYPGRGDAQAAADAGLAAARPLGAASD